MLHSDHLEIYFLYQNLPMISCPQIKCLFPPSSEGYSGQRLLSFHSQPAHSPVPTVFMNHHQLKPKPDIWLSSWFMLLFLLICYQSMPYCLHISICQIHHHACLPFPMPLHLWKASFGLTGSFQQPPKLVSLLSVPL